MQKYGSQRQAPEAPQPPMGNHLRATPKNRMSHMATTKLGTVTPRVAVKVTRRSRGAFWWYAANMPAARPPPKATRMVSTPTCMVTAQVLPMRAATVVWGCW